MASLRSVLLADEDEHYRENVAGLLRAKGFSVMSASDGVEALLGFRHNGPDVAVLAVILPKIDGGRVCRLIRQGRKLRHIHVVALSSLSLEDTKRCPELSADALVAKRQWKEAGQDIRGVIEYLENGQIGLTSGIFSANRFRPTQLPNDVLLSRRYCETLLRGFSCGVVELDTHGESSRPTRERLACWVCEDPT